MEASYRFARRPKWLIGHVLALIAIVGFINLGFWQLRRHDERSARNATMSGQMAETPAAWGALLVMSDGDPAAAEFRRVALSGTYLVDDEVLWQARTLNGQSGHDVLTPLLIGDRAIMVNRGWVPIDASGPPVSEARPPAGEVTVRGIVLAGHARAEPGAGAVDRVSRIDLTRLQEQMEPRLVRFYVQLESQSPQQAATLPLPQRPPAPDAGPHLSYAFQWFVFALIAAVGYPILLRKSARDEAESR